MSLSEPASFTFDIDDDRQVIHVVSAGVWTAEDARNFAAEFRRNFSTARERFGRVRVLVDGREAVTHDVEISKRLAALRLLFDQPDDRFALVTTSSLRKMQASQDGLPETGLAFISREAAEMWLFAHD